MIDGSADTRLVPLRGMILAAGYGTRLAPVTDHVPKPLLPVGGRPLLDHVIAGFDRAGVGDIGVNTHHLGDMVADYFGQRPDAGHFTQFPEKEILGTGGALHGAREFLGGAENFLLHNGDVLSDANLSDLIADHQGSGALATLLLVDWPAVNSVTLAGDGRIVRIAGRPQNIPATEASSLTYTGIGVFSRRLLDDIGPGFSSLIDPLIRALEADAQSVRGFSPPDFGWSDLGTLARYLAAQDFTWKEPFEGEAPAAFIGLKLDKITGHGSDRKFWRMAAGKWSAVAMVSSLEDEEFDRFTAIAAFLENQDLGGATLLSVSEAEHAVLMEDLGAGSLLSLVQNEGPGSARVQDAYRQVVDHLLDLQSATESAPKQCPVAVDRCLDYDSLRWETDYFRERFLAGHLGLGPAQLEDLDEEFHLLATAVAAQPLVLIHRDFQSQNIHLHDGRIRLVDFQGMRMGPLTYDLMSLLLDPYVVLPAGWKAELLDRFATAVTTTGSASSLDPVDIKAMALASGLQRIMQALGAFGFLGHVKGKTSFLDHIPAGLATLRASLVELKQASGGIMGPAGRWLPGSMPVLERLLDSAD